MRIVARRTLREYWQRPGKGDSEAPLNEWCKFVESFEWNGPADVKAAVRSASFVGKRIVFNVAGNKYRLVVGINYPAKIVHVKWLGTHDEYDRIDVRSL